MAGARAFCISVCLEDPGDSQCESRRQGQSRQGVRACVYLGTKLLMGSTEKVAALDVLDAARIIFQHRTMAIRDLLAIYRAS